MTSTSFPRAAAALSLLAPLAGAVANVLLVGAGAPDDVSGPLLGGVLLVVASATGLVAALAALAVALGQRRRALALTAALAVVPNAALLWFFAPSVVGLYL